MANRRPKSFATVLHQMCRSKSAFKDPPDAAVQKAKSRGVTLRYYLCPHCKHFHLTRKGMKQVDGPERPRRKRPKAEKPGRFDPGGAFDRYLAKLRKR